MGSTALRMAPDDPPAPTLALAAGLAVQAAVNAAPGEPRALLKWPNDLMVGSAKLAGILLERVGDHVIVGIGVNLASAPALADRETVALSAFGPPPAPEDFAEALAAHFCQEVRRWRGAGLGGLLPRWEAAAHPPGTRLVIDGGALAGRFAGLDSDGALRLTLADGTTRAIHAGDVTLAR